jgi:hypothetical protein
MAKKSIFVNKNGIVYYIYYTTILDMAMFGSN